MKGEITNIEKDHINMPKKCRMNMDILLKEHIGEFGPYQLRTLLLVSAALAIAVWSDIEYVFATARIPTRCRIPICENSDGNPEFAPNWILNAVPATSSGFDSCNQYANTSSIAFNDTKDACPAELFDHQNVVPCDEYVYETDSTIVYDFDLACQEWRRSFLGTVRVMGLVVGLPVGSMISDQWGRRTALIFLAVNSSWIGVICAYVKTYNAYMVGVFMGSAIGGGTFSCAYLIVMEMIGSKHRVLATATIMSAYFIGQAVTALIAWVSPNRRNFLLAVYIPQLIAITYLWILPESPRWMISKGQYDKAEVTLKNMARMNNRDLSEQTLIDLRETAEDDKNEELLTRQEKPSEPWLIVLVFRNRQVLLRCIVVPVWWISSTFIYHGLTVNAVNISGNSYLNFISACLVSIPGAWMSVFCLNTFGRKPTLILSLWICSAGQLAYVIMPNDMAVAPLAIYMISKCASAGAMCTLYLYTVELFPTRYRHRLVGYCSTVGRFGAMIAPLTPAFGEQLPFILFGSFGVMAGALVFLTPETLGRSLPDAMGDTISRHKKDASS